MKVSPPHIALRAAMCLGQWSLCGHQGAFCSDFAQDLSILFLREALALTIAYLDDKAESGAQKFLATQLKVRAVILVARSSAPMLSVKHLFSVMIPSVCAFIPQRPELCSL